MTDAAKTPAPVTCTTEDAMKYEHALTKLALSDAAVGAKNNYAVGKLARRVQKIADAGRKEVKRVKELKLDELEAEARFRAIGEESWTLDGCLPIVVSRYFGTDVKLEPSTAGILGLLEDSPFVAVEPPEVPKPE